MNLTYNLFNEGVVKFPELPVNPLTTFTFPDYYSELMGATLCPPVLNSKDYLSSDGICFAATINANDRFGPRSYFQRADPNRITEEEIYSNFTQREIDDPFNEIEPLTLQRLRSDRNQPLLASNKRIELSGSKPLLYYQEVRDISRGDKIRELVLLTDPKVDWVHDLTVELSRSSAVATGNIQISRLQRGPFVVNSYTGSKQLYCFIADGLSYANGTALAGCKVFIASDEIIFDILPFLQKVGDEEPVSIYCSFQSHPGCVDGQEISEVFYITQLHL